MSQDKSDLSPMFGVYMLYVHLYVLRNVLKKKTPSFTPSVFFLNKSNPRYLTSNGIFFDRIVHNGFIRLFRFARSGRTHL